VTEEVQGFPIDWEGPPVASNYFAALAGKRTTDSSTILVADVVVAADSCMQADSAAYHTNLKVDANQGRHQVVVAVAAVAEDFRTGYAKRDFAVARIGCAGADRIQLAASSADFRIDLVAHPEALGHTAAEGGAGGVEDLAADHTDCGHRVAAVGVGSDLEHLACGERSVEDSS